MLYFKSRIVDKYILERRHQEFQVILLKFSNRTGVKILMCQMPGRVM